MRSKLPQVGTTIFTVMSKMAHDEGAINLSQGYPGFGADPVLLDLVAHYTKSGYNQYAPMSGIPQFRQRVAEKTLLCYGVEVDPDQEVTIVSGATEAIFSAITAVVHPEDEVVILEPAYDSYEPAIQLAGGITIHVPLDSKDFSVDWERVKHAITYKTKLIVINTPHNPSGYVWTEQDMKQLSDLVRDRNIYVVSDEVYEHITFDQRPHLSLVGHPELRKKTFVCGSFGKTFHVTGWKIGYCIAPPELSKEFRKVHQFVTFSTVTPLQFALCDYLEKPERYETIPAFYEQKRDLFLTGLKKTDLILEPTQGSFFQTARYGHLSKIGDKELAERMTRELKVACIPVSAFYHDHQDDKIIRFCFAKENQELEKALKRLEKLNELF